ncbi:hypothetical protein BD311DRAFT_48239 [Dichomitus squalens]|uniref:Uncharacterized protein n=1 Tax=Dichomitus squalens TaxID=114155 RepID=A0A4Q9MBI9_9APHY|nr:hypothetical protein BD311DRAFT_48239 [Dichomitus squalens]
MRRAGSTRATSPTNTTYSGISNYRTDSYKPLMRDAPNKEYTTPDPRAVARIHFEELSQYLAAYLAKGFQSEKLRPKCGWCILVQEVRSGPSLHGSRRVGRI